MLVKCLDCPAVFPASSNGRRLRCRACVRLRIAVQKLQSQRQRLQTKRRNEMADITSAEIDARFDAALKEIRRQPSEGMEPFRSYNWLYKEPRS